MKSRNERVAACYAHPLMRSTAVVLLVMLLANGALAGGPVEPIRFVVTGFEVGGDNPLSAEATRAVLQDHLGEHVGLGGLHSAAEALESAIRGRGFAFHRVVLPPQRIEGGMVRLEVLAFEVGQIQVEGNRHFGGENIRRSLPHLVPGETPNTSEIGRDLEFANQGLYKQVKLLVREAPERPDAVEARLLVEDQTPWSIFGSLANTGTAETGRFRLALGLEHGNLFDRDQALSVTYITSPDQLDEVRQLGAFYRVPVYRFRTRVSAYGVTSDVDSGTVGDFTVTGSGRFWGLRLEHLLPKQGSLRHQLHAAFDDKRFDNDVRLIGIDQDLVSDVRSRPWSVGYSAGYERVDYGGSLAVTYAANLAGSGSLNSDSDYNPAELAGGPSPDWDLWRYALSGQLRLPYRVVLSARYTGQAAGEALIPGEQFGLGGAASVRGFNEREFAGDDGHQVTLELLSPPWWRNLQGLAFVDWGEASVHTPVPPQPSSIAVASVGVGLRWGWGERVSLALDYAVVVDSDTSATGATITTPGSQKLHGTLLVQF